MKIINPLRSKRISDSDLDLKRISDFHLPSSSLHDVHIFSQHTLCHFLPRLSDFPSTIRGLTS